VALFDAIERIYGIPAARIANAPAHHWTKPHARAVRDFLLRYYPNEHCRARGYRHYPYAPIAAICPEHPPAATLPAAISAEPSPPPQPALSPEQLAIYTSPLREATLWDGETYRLLAFDPATPQATFATDSFLRFRLTSGLMREELHYALSTGSNELPLRAQLAPDAAALLDLQHHAMSGGVHTLCAFARPAPHNDFIVPLQRRSTRVGVAGGSFGVIPMAFHQPTVSSPLDPREPATTALREIFEELFGGIESHAEAKFLTHPAIEWIRTHPADTHFETTNFFISLFGGNYDFSLLLAITNTDFWRTFGHTLETGWESGEHYLLGTHDQAAFHRILHEPDWEAQALGCCLDGLRRLRAIDPTRTARDSYDLTAP